LHQVLGVAPGTSANVTIGTTITNLVNLPPALVVVQSVAAGSTAATVTDANPTVALTDDTFVTSISSTASETNIDVSALTGSKIPQELVVTTSTSTITFPSNVTLSGLPADGVITIEPSTKTATGISGNIGPILEFGDPNFDITFDLPVRILLPDKNGGTAFFINAAGVTTEITLGCGIDDFVHVNNTILIGGDNGKECKVDKNPDLIIWTEHFTAFGAGGGGAISSSGGGGSSGDGSPPSITVGFASVTVAAVEPAATD